MTTPHELAEALEGGESAPEGVLAEDWTAAAAALAGTADPAALPTALALAVLEAAVARRTPGPAERLVGASDREVAKAAKRALYRLRSAGVAVAEVPRPAPPAPPPAPAPTEALPAYVTLPDGAGERALLLAQPLRGGGVELVEAVLSDVSGIVSLARAEVTRSGWRKFSRESGTQRLVAIPFEEGRALLAEAVRLNLSTGAPFPPDADVALRHFQVEPAREPPAPLPPPEDGDAALAVESGTLHAEPELAAWLPPEEELKRLALRVDEVRTSPLALSPEQQGVALGERIRAQAEEYFTPERQALYARRLWAVAPAFERRGATHAAAIARATARRMAAAAPGLFPPFAEQLFTKVLALLAAQAGRRGAGVRAGAEAPGRGPAPSDAAPGTTAPPSASAAPGERRSPGGLILP